MATIGNLDVGIRARPDKFQRGMSKAIRSVRKFARAIPGTSLVTSRFSAILSGAAVVGFGAWIKSSLDAVDATAKLADRIGTTTEELVGLRHAAEITGAGTNLLDRSLDVLSKRLGEAAGGTGEARDALETLGLRVEDLLGLNPAQQFKVIAEEVSKLGTQQEKAAVTSDLFSRAGLRLVNTLDLGAAGLEKMQQEAEDLGLTFSRDQARRVEEANDALTRMRSALSAVGRTMAIGLAPLIERMATGFTGWAKEGENLGDVLVDAMVRAAQAVARFSAGVRHFDPMLALSEFFAEIPGLKLGPKAEAAKRRREQALDDEMRRIEEFFADLKSGTEKNAQDAGRNWAKMWTEAMLGYPAHEQSKREINKWAEQWVAAMTSADPPTRTISRLLTGDDIDRLRENMMNVRRVLEPIDPLADRVGNSLAGIAERAIFGFESLGEAIRNVGLELAQLVFRQTVTQPLANAISGAISGIGGEPGPLGPGAGTGRVGFPAMPQLAAVASTTIATGVQTDPYLQRNISTIGKTSYSLADSRR